MICMQAGEPPHFDTVIVSLRAATRDQVVGHTAKICAAQINQDAGKILYQLYGGNGLVSPCIGGGTALMHCQLRRLARPYLFFAHLEQPVPFGASDGLPVDLVTLAVSPVRERGRHLQLVARIRQMMSHPEFCTRLRDAQTRGEAEGILREAFAACRAMLRPFNPPGRGHAGGAAKTG
jgi:mannitol/fructose-specific phosphotransferase system IIA component (Ntr-type)